MNLAIIERVGAGAPGKKYAFSLPENVVIEGDTLLLLDTRNGDQIGRLVDRVEADGTALDYILRGLGTDTEHVRSVKGVFLGKTFDEIRAENLPGGRYDVGGEAYLRVCRERNEAEYNYRETVAKLIETETERDLLKSKLDRVMELLGVGEC